MRKGWGAPRWRYGPCLRWANKFSGLQQQNGIQTRGVIVVESKQKARVQLQSFCALCVPTIFQTGTGTAREIHGMGTKVRPGGLPCRWGQQGDPGVERQPGRWVSFAELRIKLLSISPIQIIRTSWDASPTTSPVGLKLWREQKGLKQPAAQGPTGSRSLSGGNLWHRTPPPPVRPPPRQGSPLFDRIPGNEKGAAAPLRAGAAAD